MKNASEMIDEMQDVFEKLKTGELPVKETSEMINCTGKIIGLAKVQLEYYKLKNEQPTLSFFENKE